MKAELLPRTNSTSVSCDINHVSFIFVLLLATNNLPLLPSKRLQMNVPYLLLIKVALGKLQRLGKSCCVSSAWYSGQSEGALTLCRGRVGIMVRRQYTTSEVLVNWFNGFGNGELVSLRLTFTPTSRCNWPFIAITFHVHIGEQQYESLSGETFFKCV